MQLQLPFDNCTKRPLSIYYNSNYLHDEIAENTLGSFLIYSF